MYFHTEKKKSFLTILELTGLQVKKLVIISLFICFITFISTKSRCMNLHKGSICVAKLLRFQSQLARHHYIPSVIMMTIFFFFLICYFVELYGMNWTIFRSIWFFYNCSRDRGMANLRTFWKSNIFGQIL